MKVYLVIEDYSAEGQTRTNFVHASLGLDSAKEILKMRFNDIKEVPIIGEKWSYGKIDDDMEYAEIGNDDRRHELYIKEVTAE